MYGVNMWITHSVMEHGSIVLVFTNVSCLAACLEKTVLVDLKEKLFVLSFWCKEKQSDGLFHFCCGSIYDNPFSLLFLGVSDVSEDSSDEENEDDDFSCVQFGSRYWSKRM